MSTASTLSYRAMEAKSLEEKLSWILSLSSLIAETRATRQSCFVIICTRKFFRTPEMGSFGFTQFRETARISSSDSTAANQPARGKWDISSESTCDRSTRRPSALLRRRDDDRWRRRRRRFRRPWGRPFSASFRRRRFRRRLRRPTSWWLSWRAATMTFLSLQHLRGRTPGTRQPKK